MKFVCEESSLLQIKTAKTVSKAMDVFYNPIMKLNRDISVLLLAALDKEDINIGLPLEGSGIRGIRLLKELDSKVIGSVSFNDYSFDAVKKIKETLTLNGLNKYSSIKNFKDSKSKIKIYNEDGNLFLLNSKGFDYIDIDPFGTSNPFLDAAVKRISRRGILAVTNTDTAGLAGSKENVCKRLYWATPKRDYLMHETGLRILIRKIQLVGMQYDKALIPVFCYFKDHYFRMYFRCVKAKKECDSIVKQHGMFNSTGPMWLGKLFDAKLVSRMYKIGVREFGDGDAYNKKISIKKNTINKNPLKKLQLKNNNYNNEISKIMKTLKIKDDTIEIIDNSKELLKFLSVIKDESKIPVVGFYDTHQKGRKINIRKDELISKLKKKKFKASSTHFSGTGIRTTASEKDIKKLV